MRFLFLHSYTGIRDRAGYAALVMTIIIMAVGLTIIGGLTFFSLREVNANRIYTHSLEARYTAESGMEDVVYRLISGKQFSTGEQLAVGTGTTTLTLTTTGSQRVIRSEGVLGTYQQNMETRLDITTAAANFYYGIQVGAGGLTMDNNSSVTGNVASDGSITGAQGATISGDVTIATGLASTPTIQWNTNDKTFNFATTSSSRDIAQSFTATASGALNKVSVYLGKAGSPSNITLRLVSNNSGDPDRTDIANTTINASAVGTNPSWIDVSFSSAPSVVNGTKYWIVLDYSANSTTNYWKWSMDSTDGYASNTGKYTDDWNGAHAVWKNTGGDLDFRVWIGGISNKLDSVTVGSSTAGTVYADLFVNDTVHGASCPPPVSLGGSSYCIDNQPQSPQPLPLSAGIIQDFKDDASSGGTYSGNYTINTDQSIGPLEITGDLVFGSGNTTVTVSGTVYVHGNIDFTKTGVTIQCAAGYGANSCVIVTDGWIYVKNNAVFNGSGTSGSFIMLLSTLACDGSSASPPCDTAPSNGAIEVRNNALGAIFYASEGLLTIYNGVHLTEATSYKLHINQTGNVTYDQGLANVNFVSGPSGGYDVKYWREVE